MGGKLGPRVASRLSRNACLSPSAVVTSMIYLKRLKMNNPEYLQRVPSSELFIVSMMVASKYLFDDGTDDECYNDEWADCMGFDLHRLGELEVEFLNALDWKCHVSVDQFSTVLKQLEVELALNQQSKSGLFTYNTARNLDIMVAMIDTMKLVSKLFMLSAVTLLGFTSALDSIGKNCLDENTDLNTEKWDTNRLPVNETSQTGVEAPENSRIPVLISDIDEVIDSVTEDRLTDQMDANETILRENDFVQSISKITSPAMSNSRCFSGVCGPVTENQRLLVSVII